MTIRPDKFYLVEGRVLIATRLRCVLLRAKIEATTSGMTLEDLRESLDHIIDGLPVDPHEAF